VGVVSGPLAGRRGFLLAAIACGTLLNPLNSSMIAVALTRIQADFQLGFRTASWVIAAYYLASAIGQPVMGRLADEFGHKRFYMIGLAVVGVASLAGAFSASVGQLIACRCVQAVGSSALFPAGMGMLRHAISDRRAQAIGVVSIFSSTAAALGPTLGGFLVAWQGWPAILIVNVPFVLAALALAMALPADEPRERAAFGLGGLDPVGVGLFGATIGFALAFLQSLEGRLLWWAAPAALAAVAAFVVRERRAAQPFIDLRALGANRPLVGVYGRFALVNVVFYSAFFGIPAFLEQARGLDTGQTGLVMLALAGMSVLVTPAAAGMSDRRGPRPALIAGSALMLAGVLALTLVGTDTTLVGLLVTLAVLGASTGLNSVALQVALQRAARRSEIAAASGLFMTARYTGTMLSAALLALAFGRRVGEHELHALAIGLAALSLVSLVFAVRSPPLREDAAHG
jgi:MFS family permease